jgi:probable F420-dependent oxidoreductase
MQFGVFLPTYWADYRDRDQAAAITEVAQAAEAFGYESVWANDHILAPPEYASFAHIIEPLITLATLVHVVPRLQLGTSVVVLPQRHAILVAKQAAALDILSNGRLILGIGAGWMAEEFQFLNAPFDQRGAHMDEAIAVMRTLWHEPVAAYQGRFYTFTDALFAPKPAPSRPPLWIGGNTLPAIRRAARVGDAWLPFWMNWSSFQQELASFQAKVATLQQLTGRQRRLSIAAHVKFHIAAGNVGMPAHLSADQTTIIETLQQYQQAGVTHFICDFQADDVADLLRQIRVMAEDIAPRLDTVS